MQTTLTFLAALFCSLVDVQLSFTLRSRVSFWHGFAFAWLIIPVVGLLTPYFSRGVNKPTTGLTSHANDFVNAKSHAGKKRLLVG